MLFYFFSEHLIHENVLFTASDVNLENTGCLSPVRQCWLPVLTQGYHAPVYALRGKKCALLCHVNYSTIRPQGHLSPFTSLVPVRYSVHPLNGHSFEIWYFRKLALRQRSLLTSYIPIFHSLIAAASGLTCRGQLRKSFISCQHHQNISVGVKHCEFFWLGPTVCCPHSTPFYG